MRTTTLRLPRRAFMATLAAFALQFAVPARAAGNDIVVIASNGSCLTQLSREEVANIFMGAYRKLPDGTTARPIDLDLESPVRRAFYRRLLGRSLEEINAYWARLVFSGRTSPPDAARGTAEMLERVAKDPRAIGYLERQHLLSVEQGRIGRDIRVLFAIQE